MLTTDNFQYLVGWLHDEVRDEYEKSGDVKKLAEGTFKPLKGVISGLWSMIDHRMFDSRDKVIRYADGYVYVYNGKWFERVEDSAFLEELVRRVLARLGVQSVYQLEGAKQIARPLLNRLKLTPECAYEPDRRWICFQNGVLDLKSREFKGKFSLNYCTDIILDFDYNPMASGVLWRVKLDQIIPCRGFQNDLQQFCGSLIADRKLYKSEYVAYLYGCGGNGKSVIASAIANVFGRRYCSSFSLSQIFAKETATLFIAKELKGKLLNVADDVSAKDVSGGNFKSFVSGEPIQGRSVGKGDWSQITPPMLLNCLNEWPELADDSEGNYRRQLIINTTNKTWEGQERDTQLTAKLSTTEAKQAIFNWILEGYKKYVSNNGDIRLSKESIEARALRKADSNPMRRWANERFFVKAVPVDNSDPRWRSLVSLYEDYRRYCIENGYEYKSDARKLSAMFVSMGCERKNLNGRGIHICIGTKDIDTNTGGESV